MRQKRVYAPFQRRREGGNAGKHAKRINTGDGGLIRDRCYAVEYIGDNMSFVLKKISEIRRSKKFALSLIVSYMIIMGILFATMVLTYLRTEDELEAQMCDNIYRNMDSILSTLESKICSLTTIVYSVENSEVLSQMLENEKETISNYAAYRMSQFIGNIKTN